MGNITIKPTRSRASAKGAVGGLAISALTATVPYAVIGVLCLLLSRPFRWVGFLAGTTLADAARAERERSLDQRRKDLLAANKDVFADAAYMRDWAQHILKTIAERRPRQTIVVEKNLWDWNGLMWLAGLLLCTEYFFRKIWYLD